MSKIRKLQLFLEFWFSPWEDTKEGVWESFSGNRPFMDHSAEAIIRDIMDGHDYPWEELKFYRSHKSPFDEQFILRLVDVFALRLADSFEQFGKIPEEFDKPGNAITLWKAMIHGWNRVSSRLRYPRKD